jgi:hypothetical protein
LVINSRVAWQLEQHPWVQQEILYGATLFNFYFLPNFNKNKKTTGKKHEN